MAFNFIKKVLLMAFVMIALSVQGFSADVNVTQCPATTMNDTRYILDETFSFSSTPCFDLTNTLNVEIDGQGHDFSGGGEFEIHAFGDAQLSTITNIVHDNFHIEIQNNGNSITFTDSHITNGHSFSYTGIGSGVPNTNGANMIIGLVGSFASTGSHENVLIIENNRFESSTLFPSQDDNNNLFHMYGTTHPYYGFDLTIRNNDFIGYGLTGRTLANNGAQGQAVLRPSRLLFENNVLLDNREVTDHMSVDSANFNCANFVISPSNLIADNNMVDTLDGNGISDGTYMVSNNGCTLINTNIRTTKELNNPQFSKTSHTEYATQTPLFFGSQLFSNSRYYLGDQIILNSLQQWSFSGVQGSILDLSLFPNQQAIQLKSVRTMLMGNNNKIEGVIGSVSQMPRIVVDGDVAISVSYGGQGTEYSNNWHMIEYDNGLEIQGINFDMNEVDNYGLVRKRNSAVDGIDFDFNNNIFDLNFVPANPERPQFFIGSFGNFENNQFDLLRTTNVSLIGGGTSGSVSGGHVIIDNTFNGGGFIFSKLADAIGGSAINYESKFIHNEFRQVGSLYAQPFHPNIDVENLLDDPQLNGTYFYKTTCTNYEFNVGNYYEDWDDSGFYNDSNGDGIHDSYLGLDYIERGADYEGDPIRDYGSVDSYPYNFAGQTGNAQATFDTCQSFNYNIVQPQAQNYSSGHTLISDWEFISIAYPTMVCFETLNGFTSIYEGVGTGDNKGLEYDTTDGRGLFQVKCCDSITCNNIVQESQIVEFCIGDCNLGELVVQGVQEPPQVVLGCTDSQANNYNPNATQDDGSCTYDNGNGNGNQTNGGGVGTIGGVYESGDYNILGNTIEETADNGVSFMKRFIKWRN